MTVVFGVDVARSGEDRTVVAIRRANDVLPLLRWSKADTMTTTGRIVVLIREHSPEKVVIDTIGVGAGVFDRLREMGFPVTAFNASERSVAKDSSGTIGMLNKRAAAWWRFRELLDPANDSGVSLPDDDELLADLTAPHWKITSTGRVQIEGKGEVRARLGRSPDAADAVIMAFWEGSGDDWFRAEMERMDDCPRCGRHDFLLCDDRMWRCAGCGFIALEDGVTPAAGNAIF